MSVDVIALVTRSTSKMIIDNGLIIVAVGTEERIRGVLERALHNNNNEVYEVVMQVEVGSVLNRVPVVLAKVVSTLIGD